MFAAIRHAFQGSDSCASCNGSDCEKVSSGWELGAMHKSALCDVDGDVAGVVWSESSARDEVSLSNSSSSISYGRGLVDVLRGGFKLDHMEAIDVPGRVLAAGVGSGIDSGSESVWCCERTGLHGVDPASVKATAEGETVRDRGSTSPLGERASVFCVKDVSLLQENWGDGVLSDMKPPNSGVWWPSILIACAGDRIGDKIVDVWEDWDWSSIVYSNAAGPEIPGPRDDVVELDWAGVRDPLPT
ncbi:hypothetical protein BDV96DRAFT_584887 [Lophiotrema nucula]|uniref:Uncharacterized protein n=1 Tax=Lophiotrema nucula TaxID=690887 RepID=A0A6A5YSI8_9PLEO|nr:hypothetical protein BDV96DRAFT_584887 [Lophiotrema nucula]